MDFLRCWDKDYSTQYEMAILENIKIKFRKRLV